MRYHDCTFAKSHKLRKDFFNQRRIQHHIIINAGQLFNLIRNRNLWIYKGAEPVCDLLVLHFDRANLNDLIFQWAESGGLQIEYHIGICQCLSLWVGNQSLGIIHQVSFHTIDDFKIRILDLGMICLRESLYCAMICDGNSRMSPGICPCDNILHIGNAVHITHLCMAMQFHTLYRTVIHSAFCKIRNLFNTGHGTDGQVMVIFIYHGDAF